MVYFSTKVHCKWDFSEFHDNLVLEAEIQEGIRHALTRVSYVTTGRRHRCCKLFAHYALAFLEEDVYAQALRHQGGIEMTLGRKAPAASKDHDVAFLQPISVARALNERRRPLLIIKN